MWRKWLKLETYNNVYMKEKLKCRILSVDGTNARFSFLYLIVYENSDNADESAVLQNLNQLLKWSFGECLTMMLEA